MTHKSDNEILIKDLTSGLGHNVICEITELSTGIHIRDKLTKSTINHIGEWKVVPYLRPLSRLNMHELRRIENLTGLTLDFPNIDTDFVSAIKLDSVVKLIDLLIDMNVDYRGLIDLGLALPESELNRLNKLS